MIISITQQKGGVAKTTTTQAIACILGEKNKKVLVIDFDPQGNLTFASGLNTKEKNTIYEVLSGSCSIHEAVYKSKYYDIIPSDVSLTNITLDLKPTDVKLLKEKLEAIKSQYDYIVIDTAPSLGVLSMNALVASDYAIVPSKPNVFSLQGMIDLNDTFNAVRSMNRDFKILGILMVMYQNRVVQRQAKEEISHIATLMDTKVFKTEIRESTLIEDAQYQQIPIIDYEVRRNKPIKDYRDFVKEMLREVK